MGGFAIGARVSLLWQRTRLMRNVSEDSLVLATRLILFVVRCGRSIKLQLSGQLLSTRDTSHAAYNGIGLYRISRRRVLDVTARAGSVMEALRRVGVIKQRCCCGECMSNRARVECVTMLVAAADRSTVRPVNC